jgi:hypothetical protein
MGAGASIPDTEEDARAQGFTEKQIEDYKVSVVALVRENALKALELHKSSLKKTAEEGPNKAEEKIGNPHSTREQKK